MTLIPIVPEILEGIESSPKFMNGFDQIKLENNLAGYVISFQALGEACGPTLSSFLDRGIDFRPT
jgi:hypothetical protein